jgi:hypothetical protein
MLSDLNLWCKNQVVFYSGFVSEVQRPQAFFLRIEQDDFAGASRYFAQVSFKPVILLNTTFPFP